MSSDKKVAIVTGASGNGMGRSIALTLASQGISTVINYLKNEETAREIVSCIQANGGSATAIQANIFNQTDCQKLIDKTLETYDKVDICVIGPGAGWNPENLMELNAQKSLEDINREVAPIYQLLPLVMADMHKRHWGRVIGIASNMTIPSPAYAYNVAKSARTEALLAAVNEAWKIGVTVNVIAPGPVDPIASFQEARAYAFKTEHKTQPNKVTPQDIAEGVAFLCSERANYISGCVLPYLF